MAFEYDVFISYANEDRPFARRLEAELSKRDPLRRIFLDDTALHAGDRWEDKLQAAIENARCLVMLWSDHTKGRDWVSHERVSFNMFARTDPERRFVSLNLQGEQAVMHSYQQITVRELQAAYPGADKVTDAVWQDVLQRVIAGIDPNMRRLVAPLVVLTLDQRAVDKLGTDMWTALGESFHLPAVLLRSRYGATREQWRPFNGSDTIADMLDSVARQVNARLGSRRIEWRQPGPEFWNDKQDAASRFIEDEFDTGELSVLIVDPVALKSLPVYQRLMLFWNSLARNRTVVLTLPPFGAPGRVQHLRQTLLASGQPYFDPYLNPHVPPRRRVAALCDWYVTGSADIQRLLLIAAGQLAEEEEPRPPTPYLRQGAGR